jgi:hypothetical protein
MTNQEDKELQLQVLKKNLANAELEINMINSQKAIQLTHNKLLVDMISARQRMHELAMTKYVYVNPTYAFQSDEDYVSAQKDMAEIEFQLEMMRRKEELSKSDSFLTSFEEQLASHAKAISDVSQQIKDLGE